MFGFIMRYNEDFPGLLQAIPWVGMWLKFLLASIGAFVAFAITVASAWQALTKER